jgi:hypothetical protein
MGHPNMFFANLCKGQFWPTKKIKIKEKQSKALYG